MLACWKSKTLRVVTLLTNKQQPWLPAWDAQGKLVGHLCRCPVTSRPTGTHHGPEGDVSPSKGDPEQKVGAFWFKNSCICFLGLLRYGQDRQDQILLSRREPCLQQFPIGQWDVYFILFSDAECCIKAELIQQASNITQTQHGTSLLLTPHLLPGLAASAGEGQWLFPSFLT